MPKVPRRTYNESAEQIAIFQFLSLYPGVFPHCHHVPNEGKRSISEAMRLKHMGLTSGFSDIFIAIPMGIYHGLFIELKSKRANGTFGKPTKSQIDFIENKNKMGYKAMFCYGMDNAIMNIKDYLKI